MRNGRTETRRTRVNTHRANEPFLFYEYVDTSPDASSIEYIKMTRLVRLNFGLKFTYTPQSSASFHA